MDIPKRCDEHVGDIFPPRCAECDALNQPEPVDESCFGHRAHSMLADTCTRCGLAAHQIANGVRL